MLSDEQTNRLLSLVGSANAAGPGHPWDLSETKTQLSMALQRFWWPSLIRDELLATDTAITRYVAVIELAQFGQGEPPTSADLQALVEKMRSLKRFAIPTGNWTVRRACDWQLV